MTRRRAALPGVLAFAVLLLMPGCRSLPVAREGRGVVAGSEALLLMMSDSLLYEPVGVSRLLHEEPGLHVQLADVLGRVGDARALPVLESLLGDSRAEVRRSAAFALGLLGEGAAASALRALVADEDEATGRIAVASLIRLDIPFEEWQGVVEGLPDEERRARFLPSLYRLPEGVIDSWVAREMAATDPAGRRWLVYAAGRSGGREGLVLLRDSLEHPDPWVRGWAARGIGRLGVNDDLSRLAALLDDEAAGPPIQALRAGAKIVSDGRGAAPDEWRVALRQLLVDKRPGVQETALGVVGFWLLDRELEAVLDDLLARGSLRQRQLAMAALVQGRAPRAEEVVLGAALSSSSLLRAAAAEGAGHLGLADVLSLLRRDEAPMVRLAALEADLGGGAAARHARDALEDPDVAVRTSALEWLAEHPVAPLDEILAAASGPEATRFVDLPIATVHALKARAAEPLERGAVIAFLEEFARSADYLVRSEASAALVELGRGRAPVGWVDTGVGLRGYAGIAALAAGTHVVDVETSRGSIALELECEWAPLTCVSFLKLVTQGFYDGLSFHRVVADFVVQGGDPRGDGWGGPGYTLRDEFSRRPFERGVLGMARSGNHTAGSQFFITLSRQPHLDGAYTAFGRVVEGDEVLHSLAQGDLIVTMRDRGRLEVETPRDLLR